MVWYSYCTDFVPLLVYLVRCAVRNFCAILYLFYCTNFPCQRTWHAVSNFVSFFTGTVFLLYHFPSLMYLVPVRCKQFFYHFVSVLYSYCPVFPPSLTYMVRLTVRISCANLYCIIYPNYCGITNWQSNSLSYGVTNLLAYCIVYSYSYNSKCHGVTNLVS